MFNKILKGISTALQLLPLILQAIGQVQQQYGHASGETKKALVTQAVSIGQAAQSDSPDVSGIVSSLIDASVQTLKRDPAVPEFPASKTDQTFTPPAPLPTPAPAA